MRPFWAGAAGKMSLVLVAGLFVCVARNHRRLRAGELCWLLMGTCLLLKMGRMAPVFAIVAAPALAVTLPSFSDALLGRPVLKGAVAAIVCIGLARIAADFPAKSASLDAWVNRHGSQAPGYPVEAARFVEANVPARTGQLVNEFNWGGYLAWRLGDRYQVLLDGRTQVFSPQFWRETYLGDEATRRRYLAHVRADAAVLPVEKSLFRSTLIGLGWRTVHRDDRAEVLVPPGESVVDTGE
jgi:hypothetical protein